MGIEQEVPEHIRTAAEEAEKLQQEYLEGKSENTEYPALDDTDEDEPAEETSADAEETDAEQAQETDPPAEDPVAPAADEEEEKGTRDIAYWQHRFKVLQSKYDAEVPRYARELRELKNAVSGYRYRISDLEAQLAAKPKQAPVPAEASSAPTQKLDPTRYDDYGEEVVELATMLNKAVESLEGVKGENQELKEHLAQLSQSSRKMNHERFLDAVRRRYPAFDAQDKDPAFLQWISANHIPLQQIAAHQDVDEAVRVYQQYADLLEAEGQQPPAPPTPRPPVSPPRSAPTTPAPAGKKEWTRASIAQFYSDKKTGRLTEVQAQKLEKDLFAAQHEGRIVG